MPPRYTFICTIDVVGLYPHKPHCEGLEALIIDVTSVSDPTARDGFCIEKLKCYAPLGLNVVDV